MLKTWNFEGDLKYKKHTYMDVKKKNIEIIYVNYLIKINWMFQVGNFFLNDLINFIKSH